jgi:outer membrane immunogenic protein
MAGWILRFGVAVSIFLSLSSLAFAGEKPDRADNQSYDWSGVYLGGHIGGVRVNDTIVGPINGFAGGILAGYLHHSGNAVFGIESDYYWGDLAKRGQLDSIGLNGIKRVKHGGTIRLRAGYAFDDWLVFASGGFALARSKVSGSTPFFSASDSKTHYGFVVSGGVEKAISKNWRMRAEYTYGNFGARTYQLGPLTRRFKGADGHGLRLAIAYRFNPGK